MSDSLRSPTVTRFILLYAAMYAAFGVASPFLPAFVSGRGLPPEQLGLVLGAGTAVRLLTAPLAGRIGDLIQALRVVLVVCIALAASVTLGYLPAHGFWILFGVSLLHAASLAPITVLADALALGSASPPPSSGRRGFEYGWVRGTGSAAFIIGTLVSGQAVGAFGLDLIVWLQALLLGAAAVAAILVPELMHARTEVLVFFIIGPTIVTWLTPAGALAIAALAGMLRWTVMAQSSDVMALALVQPLHGVTFALLHLACMRLIARTVPQGLEGTAQAIYGPVGIGAATALLILASGALYARLGAQGFWVMAALCALAFPLTWKLRQPVFGESRTQ